MSRSGSKRFATALLAGAVLATSAVAATALLGADAASGAAGANRTESIVTTSSPITSVVESVVSLKDPLPAADGARPAACDWISYLRYRDAAGPSDYSKADKILIAQPGIFEGAGAFDSVARNTVAAAAKLGKHIEFWALDRRSNCLEDHTGIQAGLAARDPKTAIDYYYHHTSVNGKTFAGFQSSDQIAWLGHVGMEQTVRDQYDVMTAAFPSQSQRKQKFLCGGHSLGGIVTGFFAEWDFDGLPWTKSDAGYNQCGGFFALDTVISTSMASLTGMPDSGDVNTGGISSVGNALGYAATEAGLNLGIIPRSVSLPTLINPETTNLLSVAGLASALDPNGKSTLTTDAPDNFNLDSTLQILFSRNLQSFIAGSPSIRTFNITNDAVLGGLMDDNSEPLGFLQSSVGFFTGGPVADKDFPLSGDQLNDPMLASLASTFGHDTKAIPTQPNGPLYGWLNYDQVGGPNDPVALDRNGKPFTSAAKEVTDIHELARSMGEQPLDFTEDYFPTKILTDIAEAAAPQLSSKASHPEGLTADPVLTIRGGDGLIAPAVAPAGTVTAPGYNHIDLLTASPVQNDGKPEIVSTTLAGFAAK
ncbi:hypothetical protein SAMN05892883_1191 [Jatrophihabitans sp. GAS493]|uniref:hypothetical protein n=1 Tax=Jatrophihabitans sp. GAS493 TaxID=1907575 RepID=UPI000BBFDAC1|nr:hypothetical protein [Jatrophihabitans sp. GAS493]SOD71711.1 hypothetical protein SAMN05892883_1191 [Jatrophihabitans sp. GAS493]